MLLLIDNVWTRNFHTKIKNGGQTDENGITRFCNAIDELFEQHNK